MPIGVRHVLVADILHGDVDVHRRALGDRARRGDARDGDVRHRGGRRRRGRRRGAVHAHTEVVEHQVDAVGDRLRRAPGEQQRDGVGGGVVGHDQGSRIAATREPAGLDDQLIDIVGRLDADEDEDLIAHVHGGADPRDLPVGQLRGAPVLLHVEAEQRRFVVEHPVAVRVTVDRAVRHPVAVVGRGGVIEAVAVGKGDRRVEGVIPAGEVDRLEREQRADAIRRVGAAVEGPRL